MVASSRPDNHRPYLHVFSFCAFLVILVGFNMHHFWGGPDKFNWQDLGARADLFTGIVSPFLSLLAFGGVLYTINLQRKDLAETQAEARRQQDVQIRQSFEATFFRMLSLHNEIVNAIDLRNKETGGETATGRDCFRRFIEKLRRKLGATIVYPSEDLAKDVRAAYVDFWSSHRHDLGHYFRFLYNLIRFVDEAQLPRLDSELDDPKQKYMKILRAQLSDGELVMLFYNMLSAPGFRFRKYSKNYELLDNLHSSLLLHASHASLRAGMGPLDDLPALGLPPGVELGEKPAEVS